MQSEKLNPQTPRGRGWYGVSPAHLNTHVVPATGPVAGLRCVRCTLRDPHQPWMDFGRFGWTPICELLSTGMCMDQTFIEPRKPFALPARMFEKGVFVSLQPQLDMRLRFGHLVEKETLAEWKDE